MTDSCDSDEQDALPRTAADLDMIIKILELHWQGLWTRLPNKRQIALAVLSDIPTLVLCAYLEGLRREAKVVHASLIQAVRLYRRIKRARRRAVLQAVRTRNKIAVDTARAKTEAAKAKMIDALRVLFGFDEAEIKTIVRRVRIIERLKLTNPEAAEKAETKLKDKLDRRIAEKESSSQP